MLSWTKSASSHTVVVASVETVDVVTVDTVVVVATGLAVGGATIQAYTIVFKSAAKSVT